MCFMAAETHSVVRDQATAGCILSHFRRSLALLSKLGLIVGSQSSVSRDSQSCLKRLLCALFPPDLTPLS